MKGLKAQKKSVPKPANARGPRGPMTPRALAITVLARVAATDGFLNVVLDTQLDEHRPPDVRDAAFVTELCYGATRRQLTLDYGLQRFCTHQLPTLENEVLAALRIGAYQMFFMRVPKHAAVADTVEALKRLGLQRATGFVNAVLRKLSTQEAAPLPPPEPREEFLAVSHSHPVWLVKRWMRQFGPERAEAMLVADNQPPSVVVRVNTARTQREALLKEFAEVGVDAKPTTLSKDGIVFSGVGRVEDVYGYSEGLWQVQDEAAQLVGQYAAVPEGARVFDACAAPGGKACHLAQRNSVVASDLHANKLHKIEAEAGRLGLTERLKTRAIDASKPLPEGLGEFHAVMIDAPCSGLGTLRRHPELRYRRKEEDLPDLHRLQRAILENCQAVVAPGGLLIYAVCSTDPSEGPDQVEMFLRSHPDFTAEPPPASAGIFPSLQGYLRTLPGPEGADGFFAARLRRMY
jgi:16S rRNA (cytosine967-C5)-methyltransferase